MRARSKSGRSRERHHPRRESAGSVRPIGYWPSLRVCDFVHRASIFELDIDSYRRRTAIENKRKQRRRPEAASTATDQADSSSQEDRGLRSSGGPITDGTLGRHGASHPRSQQHLQNDLLLSHPPARCDTGFSHLDCRSVLILIVAPQLWTIFSPRPT